MDTYLIHTPLSRTREVSFTLATKHLGDDSTNRSKRWKNVRIMLQIVIFSGITCTCAFVNHKYFRYHENTLNWTAFFACFGVIYAIIIGFLLENVLNRFKKLTRIIENELNSIQCARDTVYYLLSPRVQSQFNINYINNNSTQILNNSFEKNISECQQSFFSP